MVQKKMIQKLQVTIRLIHSLVNQASKYQRDFFHFYLASLVDCHAFPFQSVVRCLWHPKLNQIMVGTGNGLAKVYYDPNKSQRYFRRIACFRWMTATGFFFTLLLFISFFDGDPPFWKMQLAQSKASNFQYCALKRIWISPLIHREFKVKVSWGFAVLQLKC